MKHLFCACLISLIIVFWAMESDSLYQLSRLYSAIFPSKHAHQTPQENDTDSYVYPYKHHSGTNNYGLASSQMQCTLICCLNGGPLVPCFVGVAIIKCLKAEDQVVRGAHRPDQPVWSPLPLSHCFSPVGWRSWLATSGVWLSLIGRWTESITCTSVNKCPCVISENTNPFMCCVLNPIFIL